MRKVLILKETIIGHDCHHIFKVLSLTDEVIAEPFEM